MNRHRIQGRSKPIAKKSKPLFNEEGKLGKLAAKRIHSKPIIQD